MVNKKPSRTDCQYGTEPQLFTIKKLFFSYSLLYYLSPLLPPPLDLDSPPPPLPGADLWG